MERKRFDDYPCPIARAANIFGDWWVPLLMREAMYGVETFNEIQDNLGISKNILNRRLSRLVDEGIFQKDLYQRPSRYRYILTEKGKEALSILAAMAAWSDSWLFTDQDYPIEIRDRNTGRRVRPRIVDKETGEPLEMENLVLAPGPGFPDSKEARNWRFGERGEVSVELPG